MAHLCWNRDIGEHISSIYFFSWVGFIVASYDRVGFGDIELNGLFGVNFDHGKNTRPMLRSLITSISTIIQTYRWSIGNVIITMVPQVITNIVGFITTVLIARGLGPKGMGGYALIQTYFMLLLMFSDLGMGQTVTFFASRAVAQGKRDLQMAVLRWAFRVRIVFVGFIVLGAYFFAPYIAGTVWNAEYLVGLIQLSLVIVILNSIAATPQLYFLSIQNFRVNAIVSAGQSCVLLIGIGSIYFLRLWSLQNVIVITVISWFLGTLVFFILAPKATFFSFGELKNLMRSPNAHFFKAPPECNENNDSLNEAGVHAFAFYLLLSALFSSVIGQSDVWLMGIYISKSDIGIYNIATKLTLPLAITLGSINTVLWPRISSLKTKLEIRNAFRKTFLFSSILAFGYGLYSIIIPFLIPAIYGPAFQNGIVLGQVLCFRYVIAMLVSPVCTIGYSMGMAKYYWIITLVQLIIVIMINILFLPLVGPMAAALALIANELVGALLIGISLYCKISRM